MKLLLFLSALVVTQSAIATVYVPQELSTYFDDAEIVARVLITSGELLQSEYEDEAVVCGNKVKASVIESFKGPETDVEFFIRGMPLHVGSMYLVFLTPAQSKSITPIAATSGFFQSAQAIQLAACSKHYTGYKANWLNTSSFVYRWASEKKENEPWIIPAYNVVIPEDVSLKFQGVSLHSLEIDGEVVESKLWGANNSVVMPDIFWMYKGAYEWAGFAKYIRSIAGKDNQSVQSDQPSAGR